MSDYDCVCDYDPATVYHKQDHIARIKHRCDECGRTIWPGEVYERVRAIWEGDPYVCKTCIRCLDVREFVTAAVPCFCWEHHNMLEDAENTADGYAHEAPGLWFGFLRRKVLIKRNDKYVRTEGARS